MAGKDVVKRAGLPAVVLVAGALGALWLAERADRQMREDLLAQTRLVAEAVSIECVRALTGTEADLSSPEYLRLKDQFAAVRTAYPRSRFIYLLGRKVDGTVFFFVDDCPVGHEDESPAGMIYKDVPAGFLRAWDTGDGLVEGPFTDRWGSFVSGCVPLIDPETGKPQALLAVDFDALDWKQDVAIRAVLPAGLTTLAILVIYLVGSLLLDRRARLDGSLPRWMRCLEPALLVATGLVLSLLAAWLAQDTSTRSQTASFRHLAESRTTMLAAFFRDLERVDLEGLARLYQASDSVTAREFRYHTEYLTRFRTVRALKWIPVVPISEKESFEQTARAQGMSGFEIRQGDPTGRHEPAGNREEYYPVLRVAPEKGNEAAIGLDLGSDLHQRAAIEEALRTGLRTATEPLALEQEFGSQQEMLVFRPVFSDAQCRNPLGLVLAVLRLGDVLESTVSDALVTHELVFARAGKPFETVVPAPSDVSPPSAMLTWNRPVLTFGKTFMVTSRAGPEFLNMHPARAGRGVALAGLLLSGAAAALVSMVLNRRQALEGLVRERTDALRASEEHLSATLRSIGDGVITCDREGRITSLNSIAESLTGWTTDEAAGRPMQEVFRIINAQTREAVENPVARVLKEGVNVDLANHTALIARGGTEHQIADSCAPIRNSTGAVIGAVLVFRDVTEQYRRRERECFDLEFRGLIATVSASFVQVSDSASFDEAVDRALASLGRHFGVDRSYLFRFSEDLSTADNTHEWCAPGISTQRDNLQGCPMDAMPYWMTYMYELRPLHIPDVAALSGAEAAVEREVLQSQCIQSLIVLPISDDHGKPIGFMGFDAVRAPHVWPEEQIGMIQVLAEIIGSAIVRTVAVRDLAESEERYRLLFEQSRDAMTMLAPPSWRFTAGNPAAVALFGAKNLEGLLSLDLWDVSPEHQPDGSLSAETATKRIATAVCEGSHFFEWTHQSLDGRQIPCSVLLTRIEMGGECFLQATVRDVTALKHAEAQMRQMEVGLRHSQKLEAVGQLAAGVAHEINNPVGYVMSNLGTLQDYAEHLTALLAIVRDLDPATADMAPDLKAKIEDLDRDELDFIAGDLDNLLVESLDGCKRVRDIVQNLKSFARTDDEELALADLRECVESTLKIVWNELKYRCEIVKLYGDVPLVPCRLNEIGQVIMNLLVNAAHAIGEHGTITVTTRREQECAVLEVADTGCGIAPEHLSRVFDPFFTTKPVGKGTGLGLNICHKIIERHGGTITVASTVGKGTVFTVCLPSGRVDQAGEDINWLIEPCCSSTTNTTS